MNNSINMVSCNSDVLVMPFKDPEREREWRTQYREDNREHIRDYSREYMRKLRANNPEYVERGRQHAIKWREENPEYGMKYNRQYRQNNRTKLITFLGAKCVFCGYDKDVRGLQIDHINGGGTREVEEMFNGDTHAMYRYYLKHLEEAKENLQMLCANCNQVKEYKKNGGELA